MYVYGRTGLETGIQEHKKGNKEYQEEQEKKKTEEKGDLYGLLFYTVYTVCLSRRAKRVAWVGVLWRIESV
jgi:hypothetical protein